MSRVELHASVPAVQRTTLRDVVAAFQRDLLRVAFVMAGDDDRAVALARQAFIALLADDGEFDVDPQVWSRLLIELGRGYLHAPEAVVEPIAAEPDEAGGWDQAGSERARLREALDRLDPRTRAALALHDLGGLDGREVAALAGFASHELDPTLERARVEVREAAGRDADEMLQPLLISLALDAPRVDLRPEVETALEEIEARRHRRSHRILAGALGLFLVAALASAVWLIDGLPFAGGSDPDRPPGDDVAVVPELVPTRLPLPTVTPEPTEAAVELVEAVMAADLQIQGNIWDESARVVTEERIYSFDPTADRPLDAPRPSAYRPLYPSPDGRWTVLYRREEVTEDDDPNDTRTVTIFSAALDGEEAGWEYEISGSGWHSAALGERLYVATVQDETPTLAALDLPTGEIVGVVTLDLPVKLAEPPDKPRRLPGVNVWLVPFSGADAPQLYAFVTTSEHDRAPAPRWSRAVYRIHPETLDMELVSSTVIEEDDPGGRVTTDFEVWSARMLPDGSGLYQLIPWWIDRHPSLRILDFESGQITTLRISFSRLFIETSSGASFLAVNSNDGRRLYVLSNLTGEVAVIDLIGRRVERIFPLDHGGLVNGPINARSAHLSHDGRWLYLVQNVSDEWDRSGGIDRPPDRNPVWVVNLTTWRVTGRFDPSGSISSMYLDPDGERIYVISWVRNVKAPEQRRFLLMTFETEGWKLLNSTDLSESIEQDVSSFNFQSPADSYRDTYGRTPTIDGIESEDVEEYTTLPRVGVVTQDQGLPIGVSVPVEVRFLDPATGEPLTSRDPRVRYDPDWHATLVFEHPGAKSLITVSTEIAPGQQGSTIRLSERGVWSARVIVGDEESGFSLVLHDVFRGVPTFEGDDGRPYYLRLETEPDVPIPAGEILIRVSFVDAATGEPIPEDVTLVGGLPEEMTLRMSLAFSSGGSARNELPSVAHGVYESTVDLSDWGANRWQVWLVFLQPESGERLSTQLEMGFLDVVEGP